MDKTRLLEQIARSRLTVQVDAMSLRDELNFRQKAADAVRSNPVKWLGGAVLSGYFFAKLRGARKSKPTKSAKPGEAAVAGAQKFGVLAAVFGLLRFLAPVLRPVLMSYASQALAKYAAR